MTSQRRTPGKPILFRIVRAIILTPMSVVFRVRVRGREKVPRSGAYVIAPSHRSLMDIFFAGYVTRRRIRFMAKQELFEHRLLGRLLTLFGAFPVDRGAVDRAALRAAQDALEGGEPVTVYPEGTRRAGPDIEDLFDGAAYLAARLRVPIVPVGIGGSEQILPSGTSIPRLRRVVVVVGDPIQPPQREGRIRRQEVTQLTEQLRVELQKRFDEALTQAGVSGTPVGSER